MAKHVLSIREEGAQMRLEIKRGRMRAPTVFDQGSLPDLEIKEDP